MRGAKQKREMFEISDLRRREILLYFHTYIGTGYFFWFKLLNFNFLGFFFFRKLNIFGGMKILWIFFWVITKIGLYLEVISIHLKV